MLIAGDKGGNKLRVMGGGPILSYQVITPNEDFGVDEVIGFVGSSTTAPCSDLHRVFDLFISGGKIPMENEYDFFTSDDLIEMLHEAKTCFKIDFIKDDNTYSSGDLVMTWDANSNEYTKVSPSSFVLDFSS